MMHSFDSACNVFIIALRPDYELRKRKVADLITEHQAFIVRKEIAKDPKGYLVGLHDYKESGEM
jgi:hypothetical protein